MTRPGLSHPVIADAINLVHEASVAAQTARGKCRVIGFVDAMTALGYAVDWLAIARRRIEDAAIEPPPVPPEDATTTEGEQG